MDKPKFTELVHESMKRCNDLLVTRGVAYSNEDTLSAFKKTAELANALEIDGNSNYTGTGIANILFLLKQVRNANQRNSGQSPVSKIDTVDDMINYVYLMYANEIDEYNENNQPPININMSGNIISIGGVTPAVNEPGNIGGVKSDADNQTKL